WRGWGAGVVRRAAGGWGLTAGSSPLGGGGKDGCAVSWPGWPRTPRAGWWPFRSCPAATSSGVSFRRMSMPSTSPAKQGPTWRMVTGIVGLPVLARRRPGCGDREGVRLLVQHHALGPGRRPIALHRLGAPVLAVAHVLVG